MTNRHATTPSAPHGAVRPVVALCLAVAALVPAMTTAGAVQAQSASDDYVDLSEAPAMCEAGLGGPEFAQGVGIDCVIPIVGGGDPTNLFAYALDDAADAPVRCTVQLDGVTGVDDGPALLCSDIGGSVFGVTGPREIDLEVEFDDLGSMASIEAVEKDHPVYVEPEQPLVGDSPLRLYPPPDAVPTLNLIVRERRSGREVKRIPAEDLQVANDEEAGFLVDPDLPAGLYRFWPCVGADVADCDERAGGYPFEVISPNVSPVFPGRNHSPEGRINILFVGSGLDDARWDASGTDLRDLAIDMLGLDGPKRTRDFASSAQPHQLFSWGPFAVDPMAPQSELFNFWTLDQPVRSETTFSVFPDLFGRVDQALGLPNVAIVNVSGRPEGGQIVARLAGFGEEEPVPDRSEIAFGRVRMYVNPPDAEDRATALTHELGHSLFALADEYVAGSEYLRTGWNCVESRSTAEERWGGLQGRQDPFAQVVLDTLAARGIDVSDSTLLEDTKARIVQGGCFGSGSSEVYRPSRESMMNQLVPVWGAVNRARIEEVLGRFERPTDVPDDVERFVVTTDPARFADTRPGAATVDGRSAGIGRRSVGEITRIQIAGRNGIPAEGVGAAVVNLTAIRPDGVGFATVFPCTGDVPLASSINFGDGNGANELIAELDADGALCVFTSGRVHLAVDVAGWAPDGSEYTPVRPARLADTREGAATVDGVAQGLGRRGGGQVTEIQIAGRGTIPLSGIEAAVLNLTAVRPDGIGFVTAYPCTQEVPLASSLNYVDENRPNEIVAMLSPRGTVCVYTEAAADIVIDAVGWIPSDSDYTGIEPARLVDTRAGGRTVDGRSQGLGRRSVGEITEIQVTGRAGIPGGADAAIVNLTAVRPDGIGFLTVYPCTPDIPVASSLNYVDENRANEIIVKLSRTGSFCVRTSADVHLVADAVGYVANPT